MNKNIVIILLSAILYGISIPFSKIFLKNGIEPVMLASFTYLGAGIGMAIYCFLNKFILGKSMKQPLTKKELPYTCFMVLFDIAAIIFLMKGVSLTNSANASLLSNCEIVATSLIAFIFFKEYISKKLWISIIFIIIAGAILTFEGTESFKFSVGSFLVIISYLFWGAENNCTKMISSKNIQEITLIKGCFSGLGSLFIAFFANENLPSFLWISAIMLMGFFSYGLSVVLYIKSQYYIGAAKTAAYFSSAPFFGVIFSFMLLNENPSTNFYIAFIIMLSAVVLIFLTDNTNKQKKQ